MAKLKVFNKSHTRENGEYFSLKGDININSEGEFYFRLTDEQVLFVNNLLKEDEYFPKTVGIMQTGSYQNRRENLRGSVLSDLEKALDRLCNVMAKSGTEEKLVIVYRLHNRVSYFKTGDGEILPNGEDLGNHLVNPELGEWHDGREGHFDDSWSHYAVQVYAVVAKKVTVTGSDKVDYQWPDLEESWAEKLNRFRNLPLPSTGYGRSEVRIEDCTEIPYTEERAKFFYEMLLGMCKLADKFKVLHDAETLLQVADSGKFALLPEPPRPEKDNDLL
jgi:hypothetical protein